MKKNKNRDRVKKTGISLIEIMIVITIFSVLAILSTRGVLLTLRGSRKSDASGRVRANMDFSYAIMERNLRNAETVSCPTDKRVDYTDKNSVSTYFSCEDVGTAGYISSSSARLTSDEVVVSSCQFVCDPGSIGVPPSVSITATAQDANFTGVEDAQITVSTNIVLRTY